MMNDTGGEINGCDGDNLDDIAISGNGFGWFESMSFFIEFSYLCFLKIRDFFWDIISYFLNT